MVIADLAYNLQQYIPDILRISSIFFFHFSSDENLSIVNEETTSEWYYDMYKLKEYMYVFK